MAPLLHHKIVSDTPENVPLDFIFALWRSSASSGVSRARVLISQRTLRTCRARNEELDFARLHLLRAMHGGDPGWEADAVQLSQENIHAGQAVSFEGDVTKAKG